MEPGTELKKGERIRENRQGAEVEKVLSQTGNMVKTQSNKDYHITKIVRADSSIDNCIDALDSLNCRMDAVCRADGDDFPLDVKFEGRSYSRTGKTGKNIKTGEPSVEYRALYEENGTSYDARVWRTKSGKVSRD